MENKCSFGKSALFMLANTILTLFILALVVNFAPMRIANIFLNPLGVVKGVQYEQEKEYKKEEENFEKNFKTTLQNKRSEIYSADSPYFGANDAKAIVVIFSDYQCGYCKALSDYTLNIYNDPKYKGKVKFIIKDYPILGQLSGVLSILGVQGFEIEPAKFAELHHALFNAKSAEAGVSIVQKITGKKIDIKNSKTAGDLIQRNMELGRDINVRGTPGIIIGDEFIGGLIPEDEMRRRIDAELAK